MRKVLLPLLVGLLLSGVAEGTMAAAQTQTQAPADAARGPNQADRAARLKARCENRYAQAVGRMAYLETRLNLTSSQQAPFAAWRSVRLDIAKRHADACAQRDFSQDRQDVSPVDRMARMEDRLKERVADLDSERPAFAALYNALSPDQQKVLTPDRRSMARRAVWGHRVMERGMMRSGAAPAQQ